MMKKISSMACTLAAALITGTAAHALPQNDGGSPASRARTTSDSASASNCAGDVCTFVSAQSFDDLNGFVQGFISVTIFDNVNFTAISVSCSGQEYAQNVSVNTGKGSAVVHVTLDPAAIGCFGFNTSEPIVVDLSGRASGLFTTTETGERKLQTVQSVVRQKTRTENFDVSFEGVVGNSSGPFLGFAQMFRSSNVEKTK